MQMRMDPTRSDADLYRSLELEQDGLGNENLAGLGAEIANLRLQELNLLARPAAAHLEQSVDDGVQVHLLLVRHGESRELGQTKESRVSALGALKVCALPLAARYGDWSDEKEVLDGVKELTQSFTEHRGSLTHLEWRRRWQLDALALALLLVWRVQSCSTA